MDRHSDPILSGLIEQLQSDDAAAVQADFQLRQAQANWEVVRSKYAVLRDIVTRRLGFSPYSPKRQDALGAYFESDGRFRFANMAPGDAAVAALEEAEDPMTLDQLVEALMGGGVPGSREWLMRMVNAALMRKAGISKTEDGKYRPGIDRIDIEELPF